MKIKYIHKLTNLGKELEKLPTIWVVAIFFFGIMDLVTTTYGLHIGVREYHPLMRYLINNYTILSIYLLKSIVIGFFYIMYKYVPYGIGVPIGLSLLGILITINNLLAIYLRLQVI